jgi:hypothetical protein
VALMSDRGAADTRMSVRVDARDVVRLEWAPGVRIDEDLARTAMQAVDDVNDGRERPLYVGMAGTAVLTRQARRYFMRPCSASRIALVGRSPVDRVIANFSLGTMSLPAPMRFFTSEAAALAWLCDDRGVA